MPPNICYISIEDNLIDRAVLNEYAREFPFLIEKGAYSSADDGFAAILAQKPDLVFFDIEMPGMSGIEMLRRIKQRVPLAIFITSHPEYAVDGFELCVFDFIVKPLTKARFESTALRLQDYWQMREKAAAYDVLFEREILIIKEGYDQVRLPIHEVVYLEAMQDYTKVVTEQKSYLTLVALSSFLNKLPTSKFVRVHRSYAVAREKINRVSSTHITCNNTPIPIGKTYRTEIAKLQL